MIRRPPRSPLFPSTTLSRSVRPDIDDAYMSVVQMLTGSGGWPMTVWLTPGRQPFSGGTYFPPRQFLAMLQQLRQGFDAERSEEHTSELQSRSDLVCRLLLEI